MPKITAFLFFLSLTTLIVSGSLTPIVATQKTQNTAKTNLGADAEGYIEFTQKEFDEKGPAGLEALKAWVFAKVRASEALPSFWYKDTIKYLRKKDGNGNNYKFLIKIWIPNRTEFRDVQITLYKEANQDFKILSFLIGEKIFSK